MKGENHPPRIHTNNPNQVELYVIIRNHNRSEFNYYGCWRSFATDPGTTVLITMNAAKANKHVPKWTKKNPVSALWMPEVIDAAYQPPGQRTLPHFIAFYHISSKTETRWNKFAGWKNIVWCPLVPVPQILRSLGPDRLSIRMICQLFLLISCFYTSSYIIHYHPPLVSTFSGILVSPCSGDKSPPSPNSHPGDARSPHARHNLYISWPDALRPLHRSWRYYKSMPSHCPTVWAELRQGPISKGSKWIIDSKQGLTTCWCYVHKMSYKKKQFP